MPASTPIALGRRRIPSLDGIRALAITTVVMCHVEQRYGWHILPIPIIDGVELFFVLSGFLITSLLLREMEKTKWVAFAAFYGRRALRILPPLFTYFAIVIVGNLLEHQSPPWWSLLSATFFLSDVYNASFFTEHIWSLAVEEQFYLAWPLLLVWGLRRGGRRFAAKLTLLLIAASPVFRVLLGSLHVPAFAHLEGSFLACRMDSLFAGCLVALWAGTPHMESFLVRTRRWWWAAPLFFFVLSPAIRLLAGNAYIFTLGFTGESFAAAYFVVWASRHAEHPVGRFLNWRPIAYLGTLSYSLYLYQSALIHGWPGRYRVLPTLVAILVCALLSYYVVERPALRVKVRRYRESAATESPALAEGPQPS